MTRRTHLLRNLALGLSLATGLIATTTTASAQSPSRMKVTVPFSFTADNVSLSAGAYTVETKSNHFLILRNIKTNEAHIVMVRPDDGQVNNGPSRLTFRRSQDQTYLTQVWTSGTSRHSELISHPKPRRDLAELSVPDSIFEISTK